MEINQYFVLILITFTAGYILDTISDYLNLKNLKPELPEEFCDVYDNEKYAKSQEYTRVRTKFGFISSGFSFLLILIFWLGGGYPLLDELLRGLIADSLYRGVAFIALLMIAQSVISMPFSIYSTFVIEEKFGFNKTTVKTFVLDILKSTALAILIGLPLLALILWLLESAGEYAWLYGWGIVTLFSLIMQYIAPVWIMPLFNKFTPLGDGELKDSIMDYAKSVNYPLKNLFVMDGSKRSSKSNAFFTGFGKNKKIALFDTLIENHSVKELTAVLAHEIGHYKKGHIRKGMIIGFLHSGIIFWLLSVFLEEPGLFAAFGIETPSVYTGMIFFGMLYSPVETILSIVLNVFSRKNEFEADAFAAETSDPGAMITALKKLSADNLSNLTPHPFNVFINYSHPPVLERIMEIKEKYIR